MSVRRRMLSVAAVVVVAVGVAVFPASPAAAATYEVDCYRNPEGTGSVLNSPTFTITANGPASPVAPGEEFTLTDLVVTYSPSGSSGQQGFLTVLGQQIDLGLNFINDDGDGQWGPLSRTLTAPEEFGVYDIEPEGNFHRIAPNGFNFYCPITGDAFAEVVVADVSPTTVPPPPTTTVPDNDNGNGPGPGNGTGNGNGNGNGNGVDPSGEVDDLDDLIGEADRLLAAQATPRFTG